MLLAQQGLWILPLTVLESSAIENIIRKSQFVPITVLPLTEDKVMALIEVPSDFNSEGFDFEMPNG